MKGTGGQQLGRGSPPAHRVLSAPSETPLGPMCVTSLVIVGMLLNLSWFQATAQLV